MHLIPILGIAALTFLASSSLSFAQTANTACAWSLLKLVQTFEDLCHPADGSEYRKTLDEAVVALESRTRELATVPDFDKALVSMKSVRESIRSDPAQCRQGPLHDMARRSKARGVALLHKEVAEILAVPRERQVNDCL